MYEEKIPEVNITCTDILHLTWKPRTDTTTAFERLRYQLERLSPLLLYGEDGKDSAPRHASQAERAV